MCCGRGRELVRVHKVGENSTGLLSRWQVDDDPSVAPYGEVGAVDGGRTSGRSDPLSVRRGGAPCTVLDSHPPLY